jgi:hypothetical protein
MSALCIILYQEAGFCGYILFAVLHVTVICYVQYVLLYGCETYILRVFENMVLRIIFGPKRDEVTGGWRKLHNEELHNLYSSSSIIRMIESRRMR